MATDVELSPVQAATALRVLRRLVEMRACTSFALVRCGACGAAFDVEVEEPEEVAAAEGVQPPPTAEGVFAAFPRA